MLLVLKRSPEQQAALRKLLDDQQDKGSPRYHKWLTPEQFGKQFGPSDDDIQSVTLWLQSHGFQVGTTEGRTVLEFSGSARQVREAFHTAIHKYVVQGERHWGETRRGDNAYVVVGCACLLNECWASSENCAASELPLALASAPSESADPLNSPTAVSLTCTGLPSEASCSSSPVKGSGPNTTMNAIITVTTTAALRGREQRRRRSNSSNGSRNAGGHLQCDANRDGGIAFRASVFALTVQ
jgi:hypothetical protein